MSIIKRIGNITESGDALWVDINSTSATLVFTSLPLLDVPEGATIEDVFIKQLKDIELLKKNVSWLAAHGGGGSGPGGGIGGGAGTFYVEFLNSQNQVIESMTWSKTSTEVRMRLFTKGTSGTYFTIECSVNGKSLTPYRNKKKNDIISITAKELNIDTSLSLNILVVTVTDEEGNQSDPQTFVIGISSLTLLDYKQGQTVLILQNEIKTIDHITLLFQTNMFTPGQNVYRLYYSADQILLNNNIVTSNGVNMNDAIEITTPDTGQTVNANRYITLTVTSGNILSVDIPLVNTLSPDGLTWYPGLFGNANPSNNEALTGTYQFHFIIQSVNDPTIYSNVATAVFAVMLTNSIMVSPLIGITNAAPFIVSLNVTSNVSFTCLASGAAPFNYEVYWSTKNRDGSYNKNAEKPIYAAATNNAFESLPVNTALTFPITWSSLDGVNEDLLEALGDNNFEIMLRISATRSTLSSTNYIYVSIQSPQAKAAYSYMHQLSKYCLFDFTPWAEKRTWLYSNPLTPDTPPYLIAPGSRRIFEENAKSAKFTALEGTPTDTELYNAGVYVLPNGNKDILCNPSAILNSFDAGGDSGKILSKFAFSHHAWGTITPVASLDNAININSAGQISHYTISKWFPASKEDTLGNPATFIEPGVPLFSFEIAYSIAHELNDDPIICQFGDYITDITQTSLRGITITPHNLYVRLNSEVSLSLTLADNSFTHIVVALEKEGNTWKLKAYYNGKISGCRQIQGDVTNMTDLGNWTTVYLANSPDKSAEHFCNVDLYSCRLFNKAMNYGEVITSYINNYAYYDSQFNKGYDLNGEWINTKLANNGIRSDAEIKSKPEYMINGVPKASAISSLYNFETNENSKFNGAFTFGVTYQGNVLGLGSAFSNLPIPIIVIQPQEWTSLINLKSIVSSSPTKCTFTYIDNRIKTSVEIKNVDIDLQGTSTMGYDIKNFLVTYPDGTLFSPIETWLPEAAHTLKADVVDSGHFNNAVIGKFVNDIINSSPNYINILAWAGKLLLESRSATSPVSAGHIFKANLEGFPVFLIMIFPNGSNGYTVEPIGIYSFNLGRNSFNNQALEIHNTWQQVKDNGDTVVVNSNNATFPGIFKTDTATLDVRTYCIEGQESLSCGLSAVNLTSDTYDQVFVKVQDDATPAYYPDNGNIASNLESAADGHNPIYIAGSGWRQFANIISVTDDTGKIWAAENVTNIITDNNGNKIPYDKAHVIKAKMRETGYFWSPDASFAQDGIFWKYVTNNTSGMSTAVQALVKKVATCYGYNKAGVQRSIDSKVPLYTVSVLAGGAAYIFTLLTNAEGKLIEYDISRPLVSESPIVSFKNISFYYIMCMLFGLTDSFGKNMQMKAWNIKEAGPGGKFAEDNDLLWTPAFYDMDTALGLGNSGLQDVLVNCWDETLASTPSGTLQPIFGTSPLGEKQSFPTVYSNKLFGIVLDPTTLKEYDTDAGVFADQEHPYLHSQIWSAFRLQFLSDPDKIYNEYILPQFANVPELLMNFDYDMKYIQTPLVNMLYGDRLAYVKNWLRQRIYFLDSIFGYYDATVNKNSEYLSSNSTMSDINVYETPWLLYTNIAHSAGKSKVALQTSQPVVMRTDVGSPGNDRANFVYSPGNKTIEVPIRISDLGSGNALLTFFYNTPLITNIDLKGILPDTINPLKRLVLTVNGVNMYDGYPDIYKYNYGGFSGLKHLDLSNVGTLKEADLSIFALLKTWDASSVDIVPNYSPLESVDMSYINASKLSLSFGELSANTIPANLPDVYKQLFKNLISINLHGAKVSAVTIPASSTLLKLDVAESGISELTLSSLPLLTELNLLGCYGLFKLALSDCALIENITLNASNRGIKTVTISGMPKLKTISIIGDGTIECPTGLYVSNCPELTTITFKNYPLTTNADGCEVIITNTPKLATLDLTDTCVTTIDLLAQNSDFSDFDNLVTLNCTNCRMLKTLYACTSSLKNSFMNTAPGIHLENITLNVTNGPGYCNSTVSGGKKWYFKGCESITHVYCSNNESAPNYLGNYVFCECKSLEHIYGNFKITGSETFYKCYKLILFDQNGYDKARIQTTINGGRCIVHPSEISDYSLPNNAGMKFVPDNNDNKGLNISLYGAIYNTFTYTPRTLWDMYYLIYNSPELTLINSLCDYVRDGHCDLTNNNEDYIGIGTVKINNTDVTFNNNISTKLFVNNTKLTKISMITRAFLSAGPIIYKSTTSDEMGIFTNCRNTLTEASYMFFGPKFIMDRKLFSDIPNLSKIVYWSEIIFVDDSQAKVWTIPDNVKTLLDNQYRRSFTIDDTTYYNGNLAGLLQNNTKLTDAASINIFGPSISYIDFNMLDYKYKRKDGAMGAPLGWRAPGIIKSFRCAASCGEVKLRNIRYADTSKPVTIEVVADGTNAEPESVETYAPADDAIATIVSISASFYQTVANNEKASFRITRFDGVDENGLKIPGEYAKLKQIQLFTTYPEGDYGSTVLPFSNFDRVATWKGDCDELYSDDAKQNIINVTNLFSGVLFDDELEEPLEFPGKFFRGMKKITTAYGTFSNIKLNENHTKGYKLSKNLPFKDTPLSNCGNMFYNSSYGCIYDKRLQGNIPLGFLYTTGKDVTVTLSGTNMEYEMTEITSDYTIGSTTNVNNVTITSNVLASYLDTHSATTNDAGEVILPEYTSKYEYMFKYTGVTLDRDTNVYYFTPMSKILLLLKYTKDITKASSSDRTDTLNFNNNLDALINNEECRSQLNAHIVNYNIDKRVFPVNEVTHSYFDPVGSINEVARMFSYNNLNTTFSINWDLEPVVIIDKKAFETYAGGEDLSNTVDAEYALGIFANNEYSPWKYKWTKTNGFLLNASRDTNRYNIKWSYDGQFDKLKESGFKERIAAAVAKSSQPLINDDNLVDTISYDCDDTDAELMYGNKHGYDMVKMYYNTPGMTYIDGNHGMGEAVGNRGHWQVLMNTFMCPLDFFRYCPEKVGAYSLWEGCGEGTVTDNWNNSNTTALDYSSNSTFTYINSYRNKGVTGRIPPYLFEPVKKLDNFTSMFENCKNISGYISYDGNTPKFIMIPKKLFKFSTADSLNLSKMFSGWIWPGGTDLNVFEPLAEKPIDITRIFQNAQWGCLEGDLRMDHKIYINDDENQAIALPYSVTVDSTFNRNKLSSINFAFLRCSGIIDEYDKSTSFKSGLKLELFGNITIYEKRDPTATSYKNSSLSGNVRFMDNIFPNTASGIGVFACYRYAGSAFVGYTTPEMVPDGCKHDVNDTEFTLTKHKDGHDVIFRKKQFLENNPNTGIYATSITTA